MIDVSQAGSLSLCGLKHNENRNIKFLRLTLTYIYITTLVCVSLSIFSFLLYIKCGSYLLVELVYLFIGNVVRECNFAF